MSPAVITLLVLAVMVALFVSGKVPLGLVSMAGALLLAILGVASIREFALPIMFGLCAGTYSSIFLAGSLWAIINDNTVRKKDRKAKIQTNN